MVRNQLRLLLILLVTVGATVGAVSMAAAQADTDSGTPYLGLRLDTTPDGVIILNVAPDSPASESDLRADDLINAVNGQSVADARAVVELIRELNPGDTVTLEVMRDNEPLNIEVTLGALETVIGGRGPRGEMMEGVPGMHMGGFPFPWMIGMNGRLGVAVEALNADIAGEMGLDIAEGAVIREVQPNSPADEGGLQVNDVVTAVNGEPVDAERTLRDRLIAYEPGDTVVLSVLRGDETLEVDVTLAEPLMPMFGQMGMPWGHHGMNEGQRLPDMPQQALPGGV